jgi:uncharacterized protein with PIN domain
MANLPGRQPDIVICPACGGDLKNVPRSDMKSPGHKGKDGVSEETHTYECKRCHKRFEINQDREAPKKAG